MLQSVPPVALHHTLVLPPCCFAPHAGGAAELPGPGRGGRGADGEGRGSGRARRVLGEWWCRICSECDILLRVNRLVMAWISYESTDIRYSTMQALAPTGRSLPGFAMQTCTQNSLRPYPGNKDKLPRDHRSALPTVSTSMAMGNGYPQLCLLNCASGTGRRRLPHEWSEGQWLPFREAPPSAGIPPGPAQRGQSLLGPLQLDGGKLRLLW